MPAKFEGDRLDFSAIRERLKNNDLSGISVEFSGDAEGMAINDKIAWINFVMNSIENKER